MVKVLIDGKEYEGKDVAVSKYNSKYDMYQSEEKHYSDESQETVKEEPKQEFVSVPKEIQFVCSPLDADRGRWNNTSLLVNGHHLCGRNRYNNETHVEDFVWAFIPEEFKMLPLDCVLVPCKEGERLMEEGQWYFCLVKRCPDYTKEELEKEFSNIGNYCLGLGNKIVRVSNYIQQSNVFGGELSVTEQERTNVHSFNWFKVVPRSEVEK